MFSFKSYLAECLALVEGLRSDFKDIPQEVFNALVKADPTTQPNKPGSYSRWILKLYNKRPPAAQKAVIDQEGVLEHLTTALTAALSIYHKAKTLNTADKRNIDDFKTFTELQEYIDSKKLTKDTLVSKRERKKDNYFDKAEIESHDGRLVYQNKDWAVIVPETHEASVYYGLGTPWCVSVKSSAAHYNAYTCRGPMYFLLSKKERDPDTGQPVKYGFNFPGNEFKDAKNHQVTNKRRVEKWVTDEMGADVWDALDAEPKSLADLIVQKGYDDPEVKKQIAAIFDRDYTPISDYTAEGDWYIFESRKYGSWVYNELNLLKDGDATLADFRRYYLTDDDIAGQTSSSGSNKINTFKYLIGYNAGANYSKGLMSALANYYDVTEDKNSSGLLQTTLAEAMADDEALLKQMKLYYHAPENAKYFEEIKNELAERIRMASYSLFEFYGPEDSGDLLYPNIHMVLKKDGKRKPYDEKLTIEEFFDFDHSNIELLFNAEDRSSIDFVVAQEDNGGQLPRLDNYPEYDEKLEFAKDDVAEELLDVLMEYVGTKQHKDPRQMELDLQSFQNWLRKKVL